MNLCDMLPRSAIVFVNKHVSMSALQSIGIALGYSFRSKNRLGPVVMLPMNVSDSISICMDVMKRSICERLSSWADLQKSLLTYPCSVSLHRV